MQNSLLDMLNQCSEALIIEWLADFFFFFFSYSGKKGRTLWHLLCTPHLCSCIGSHWLCWLLRQSTGRRTGTGEEEPGEDGVLRRKGGGIWGKSTELAWPLLSKQHPGYVWLLYFPWSKHKVVFFFFLTKESGEPIWGKDKSLATGSQLLMDGEYPYQPIWCLPESLSIVSQHSNIPFPITRAASTSSLSPCYRSLHL